jgi:ABC-type dipeptide/oligopeptide/nickel transport system ATPase component
METTPFFIATTAGGAGVHFSREERERHLYIVGKSGSGKSHSCSILQWAISSPVTALP